MPSGFNIRKDISLNPRYRAMLGLCEKNIRDCLQLVCSERGVPEDEKQNFIDSHHKQIRLYYNGYRFEPTQDSGVYCTNLCLTYLSQLLAGHRIDFVDPNHEINDSILGLIAKRPDSFALLAELLDKGQTEYNHDTIQNGFRLSYFRDMQADSIDYLKSFLVYVGSLTFSKDRGFLCVPNFVVHQTIIKRINQIFRINTESHAFKAAIDQFLTKDSIELLCTYLEEKFRSMIKKGNLGEHNELVTKTIFHSSLSRTPYLLSDTEVEVPKTNICGQRVLGKNGYIDLLTVDPKPVTGKKPRRYVIGFKNKGVKYLDLQLQGMCVDGFSYIVF